MRTSCIWLIIYAILLPRNAAGLATPSKDASSYPPTKRPQAQNLPKAAIEGYLDPSDISDVTIALKKAGFEAIIQINDGGYGKEEHYRYSFVKATGMLKLVGEPSTATTTPSQLHKDAPRWIPMVTNMENVLVKNGWSFLDPDENEMSPFDVDAANEEGLYRPKWGANDNCDDNQQVKLSSLGYDLKPLSEETILEISCNQIQEDQTRKVLLEGATDPPHLKQTHNGYDFSGSIRDLSEEGIFVCAIGGLPLFATSDLSPTTASSGWLSFSRPISEEHVILVKPPPDSIDQRTEVLCGRSQCHLGHYFGRQDGYCINASALDFLSKKKLQQNYKYVADFQVLLPTSWRSLESTLNKKGNSPSLRLLREMVFDIVDTVSVVLGAGCFWHVQHALNRLPGVVGTKVGYAGGTRKPSSPIVTYEEVCQGDTGHAEVVQVTFDPNILKPRVLFDCFLALHDPTKVRAHGKHAKGTGQYRSCIFVTSEEMLAIASQTLEECQHQLQKEISTELRLMESSEDPSNFPNWFFVAEDRHQHHEERKKQDSLGSDTLSATEWLQEYGRRSKSIWGSSETIQ